MTDTVTDITAVPLALRVAVDLRALADIAAADPELATRLADTLGCLYVVLDEYDPLTPDRLIDALVAEHGATPGRRERPSPPWAAASAALPAGAIRLVALQPQPDIGDAE
ncbi:hypothetical protein [Pseudonocardia asaccharolytica]|uniref:Uncharacterized protein n=1 Tax=Pseudonocardia asaccharolytica DSM 44247 = NBRC 16224 TaxID=1123024 RepID=A0A511D272_9PSEU|nr:hypothetical protein [Pseudonocardia asaccharolytica]GEL17654.1 hypothetical protein PA7_14910 [Pseudonocardia asaccharolytica DSM 44247 = NBRC 16224]